MESDQSMKSSDLSADSDNSGNVSSPSLPSSRNNYSLNAINNDKKMNITSFDSLPSPKNDSLDTRCDNIRSRSSSLTDIEDEKIFQRNDNVERPQSSQSVSSNATNGEKNDGVSEYPSSLTLNKYRDFSISPFKSQGSSKASNFNNNENTRKEKEEKSGFCFENLYFENKKKNTKHVNNEELSDVSDIENEKHGENINCFRSDIKDVSKNSIVNVDSLSIENNISTDNEIDLRHKLDAKKNQIKSIEIFSDFNENTGQLFKKKYTKIGDNIENLEKKHDEDALDFEAEEGECQEISKENAGNNYSDNLVFKKENTNSDELEEGEVSDEDEKRPEETEPKPVCRFYTRGACTWGMSCRFLHPGVTDKGNYTMFDMIRPVPIASNTNHVHSFPSNFSEYRERPSINRSLSLHHSNFGNNLHVENRILVSAPAANSAVEQVPVIESAWERGLRTAKEMMRKANKRKEQDIDFEDKKMNLTLSPDELEKDNYYIRERGTPEINPSFTTRVQVLPYNHDPGLYNSPSHRILSRSTNVPPFDDIDPYGRSSRYRELPPHRMPQYEDERRVRPTREVIVQRIEPSGRADEWSDPWMRSKSPGGRERDKRSILRRSYSSNSSYTSTSTSRSGSSSETSRSLSPDSHRKRYNTQSSQKSPLSRRHLKTTLKSPNTRRRSTSYRHSSLQKKRHISRSSSPRHLITSPGIKRKQTSPFQKRLGGNKSNNKKTRGITSSSASGSSDSSGSESESSYSSSSSSLSHKKLPIKRSSTRQSEKVILKEKRFSKKGEMSKKRSPISIELKKTSNLGASALSVSLERDNNSNSNSSSTAASAKKNTRREELLKQLRAVEDAIARKKSKLS